MKNKILSLLVAYTGLLLCSSVSAQAPLKSTILPANGFNPQNLNEIPSHDQGVFNQDAEHEDGMLEAMKQEVAQTKDPALGYVPRQRLCSTIQKLNQQKATRSGGLASKITWDERGPNNKGGRTRAIMIDPNDPTHQSVFAAGVGGGLWKTTRINAADPAWKPINDTFANLAIVTICYDSAHPKTMYFGTGEGWFNSDAIQGDGIFKSTDGGNTWKQLAATNNNTDFQFIQKVIVDPKTSYLYAGTHSGLFRSKDGGTTWNNVLNSAIGSTSNGVCDIAIGVDDSIYVAMGLVFYGLADGIYKSYSGDSSTWIKKNKGTNGFPTSGFERIALACSPTHAAVIYAMTHNSSTYGLGGIYKSTDGGNNWTTLTRPTDADPYINTDMTRSQAWYDLTLAINPMFDSTIIVGGVDLFRSVNAGASWSQLSHWQGNYSHQYVHSDQHAIVYVPGQADTLYFGNDGGIFGSYDRGSKIFTKDSNYRVIQFYSCALNPNAGSNQMLGGAQDNGNYRFSQTGLNYGNNVVGGDGMFVHIDQKNPSYQFVSNTRNYYYSSNDSGKTFTATIRDGSGLFTNPTDYSSIDAVFYGCYAPGDYMYWTNPQSGSNYSYNYISILGSSNYVTAVTASPTLHYRIYIGSNNGKVLLVDSAISTTPTITDITGSGMPTATVKCITIDPANDQHLLVTYSNYGVKSVWETSNNGTSWTSVEGNLPDMPVRWALFDPNHSYKALLATELGVWVTDSLNGTATTWKQANIGMPNVEVDMLQWRASDNTIIAATHGRGMFSTQYFTHAPCAFTRQNIYDSLVSGTPVTINHKTYKYPGSYTDTLFHSVTHCDSVILFITITTPLGINNVSKIVTAFNISPNPSNGNFTLDINSINHTGKAYIQVVNLLGQVVDERTVENKNGNIHTTFNSNMADGLYLLKVQIGAGKVLQRLVISR